MAQEDTMAKRQQQLAENKATNTAAMRSRGRQHREKVVNMAKSVKPVSGFVDFLRGHAIIGLAIGFVLGTQVQTVVKQVISSFIDPLFVLVFPGNKALSARTFTLHFEGRSANFGWGAVAFAIIDFFFIAAAVYAIIKILKLDKLDKPQ
jgi:large-conductance mechanosensitive channel